MAAVKSPILGFFCAALSGALLIGCGENDVQPVIDEPEILDASWTRSGGSSSSTPKLFDYPETGIQLGQGWDSFAGNGTGAGCVEIDAAPIELSSYEVDGKQIKSRLSLDRERSLAITASYSGVSGSASGSLNRFSSEKIETDRFNFLLRFQSEHSSTFAIPKGANPNRLFGAEARELLESVDDSESRAIILSELSGRHDVLGRRFELSNWANELYNNSRADFYALCGYGFVSAIYRGARLDLLISSKSNRREDIERLASSISASGYGASVSVSSNFNSRTEQQTQEANFSMRQEGGYPVAPPKSLEEIDTLYNDIEAILDAPRAYRIKITSYSALRLEGSDGQPGIPSQINDLADYYIALRELKQQVDDLYVSYQISKVSNPALQNVSYAVPLIDSYQINGSGSAHLSDLSLRMEMHLSVIERIVKACTDDIVKCQDFDAFLANLYETSLSPSFEEAKVTIAAEFDPQSEVQLIAADTPGLSVSTEDSSDRILARATAALQAETVTEVQRQNLEQIRDVIALEQARRMILNLEIEYLDEALRERDAGDFYMRFYKFLADMPLPEDIYPLKLTTATSTSVTSRKGSKYHRETTTVRREGALDPVQTSIMAAPQVSLERLVLAHRLVPWSTYFCDETLNHLLCASVASLESVEFPQINEEQIRGILNQNLAYISVSQSVRKSRRGGIAGCC